MTGGQEYYDGLITQGYTPDQAQQYTVQHFPGFSPTAPPVLPISAFEVNQQEVAQIAETHGVNAEALADTARHFDANQDFILQPSEVETTAQAMTNTVEPLAPAPVAAPAMAAPVADPAMAAPMAAPGMAAPVAAPMGGAPAMPGMPAPMAGAPAMPGMPAPMAGAPAMPATTNDSGPVGWAAVACITLTLVFSIMGIFGNSWLISPDSTMENDGMTASTSTSLSDAYMDITKIGTPSIDENFNVTIVPTDFTAEMCTAMADPTNGSTCDGTTMILSFSKMHDACTKVIANAKAAGATDAQLTNSTNDCDDDGAMASSGSTGGLILWAGVVISLIATVLILFNMLGLGMIPVDTQKFGMIAGIVAGAIVGLAVLIWYMMLPDGGDASAGLNVWLCIMGAVTGIASGVLIKMFGQPSN